ncbi:HAD hydrolase-like protein [Entomospira entomophila]|uniref:HAD hydrolase-like protein n=1 Tax=Entomospira entomophila TaxID=2719988 RepID=A0A968G872_9SPIO|nr:HAD hydrolase-like protein [Entomospira entomophilus]NIZ40353.1 HAD hydrolase-like protein [Entomospira entomophilus]WDI35912.1 HAD hydrolase-like protein [Entomospira entomophilus]
MSRWDLIIYDFDGTLYDTRPGLERVLHQTLRTFGFDPDQYTLKDFIGPPMEWSLEHTVGAPASMIQEMLDYFRPRYQEAALEHLVFFDGALALLEELQAKKIKQAVASLKFSPLLSRIIQEVEITDQFEVIAGHDPQQPRTKTELIRHVLEQIPAKNPIMIGDRHFDLVGAQNVGIPFIGADYGYANDGDELANSTYRVKDIQELRQLLLV